MKANPDKCHFITRESMAFVINLENNQITNSKCEKLLWIKIDHKLTFYAHIDEICKKAGQKMNTLSRVIPYMNITKLCKTYIGGVGYVWMMEQLKRICNK